MNFIHRRPTIDTAELKAATAAEPVTDTKVFRLGGWSPWAVYLHDLAWAGAAMAAAILARYRFEPKPVPYDAMHRPRWPSAVCAVVFPLFRLHRSLWRFTALNDVIRIAQAVAVAVLLPGAGAVPGRPG